MAHLVLLSVVYSCIWIVPLTIRNKRRKQGKPSHWMLLLAALILEIAVVYGCLYLLSFAKDEILIAYLPPVIAALLAGVFYSKMADKLVAKSGDCK